MKFKKIAIIVAATAFLGACAGIDASRGAWTFRLSEKADGCLKNVSYHWGGSRTLNYRGQNQARYCGQGGMVMSNRNTPTGVFTLRWETEENQQYERVVDLPELLKNYDIYGGRLDVIIMGKTAQFWLIEPDKSAGTNKYGVYASKPEKLIYETQ
jgi:hypothetical protein